MGVSWDQVNTVGACLPKREVHQGRGLSSKNLLAISSRAGGTLTSGTYTLGRPYKIYPRSSLHLDTYNLESISDLSELTEKQKTIMKELIPTVIRVSVEP